MKKRYLILVLITILALTIFTGCTDDPKPQEIHFGKYYFVDNSEIDENIYVEIINENELSFHNVDFLEIQTILSGYGLDLNVNEILSGVQEYDTNELNDRLFVCIFDQIYLTIEYSESANTISFMNQVYKLSE